MNFFLILSILVIGLVSFLSAEDVKNFYTVEERNDQQNQSKTDSIATASPPTSATSPFGSALEMMDLVSKLTVQTNEVYRAAANLANKNGISAHDPVTFVPSIIIYGLLKAISYFVSIFIHVTSMIAPSDWQIDPNAKLTFIDLESLHNIDYEVISNSVRSVPERSFRLLDIKEEECKSRAMCEIGQNLHSYWPHVATYIRLAVEQLNLRDKNTGAMLRGLGWADCDSLFRKTCTRSPFSKFYQIINSLNNLFYST